MNTFCVFVVAFVSVISCCSSIGIFNLQYGYQMLKIEIESMTSSTQGNVFTNWIEQPLDHFDDNNSKLWAMRYFERTDLWRPNGPIYFFIGGEGEAHPGFLKGGMIYELANETHGAIFMSEHRYYGKSMPTKNVGAKNLYYLSCRQALADLARLIKRVKLNPLYYNSKVVVIGGSYPGNMAAWMKLLYPNLVDAALASSAPVLAKVNFYEYLETVNDVYEQHGSEDCYRYIQKTFKRYEELLSTENGTEILKKEEKICDRSDMNVPENKQLFVYGKTGYYMVNAQYGSVSSVQRHCEKLLKQDEKSYFDTWRLKDLQVISFWDKKQECYDVDFYSIIDEVRKGGDWLTSWVWQMCTEFSYAKSTTSDQQPFTKLIPIETFFKICKESFGSEFGEDFIIKSVNKSNQLYGGLKPKVTKVLFMNGDMDPWHRLGILEDVSYDAPAKVIPRSSHCRDLGPTRDSDHEELKEAKLYVKYSLKKWIGIETDDKKPSFGNKTLADRYRTLIQ